MISARSGFSTNCRKMRYKKKNLILITPILIEYIDYSSLYSKLLPIYCRIGWIDKFDENFKS
jgi:hypothetical protein